MKDRRKISNKKKVKIQTTGLLKKTESGKYFPVKTTDTSRNLVALRPTVDPETYNDFIKELERFPNDLTHLITTKEIAISNLDTPHLIFSDFDAEFAWAKATIFRHFNAINEFVHHSNLYQKKLLLGRFEEANEELDKIENKFGYSIWLIKNRIALLQQHLGLEFQKAYSQKIKNELRAGSLPRFIIHWISIRNEEQTSVNRFITQLEPLLGKMTKLTQFGYQEYCRYHLFAEDLTVDEMIQVVRLEYSSSLIDYFESFLCLLRGLLLNDESKIRSRAEHFLKKETNIKDGRLEILKCYCGLGNNLNSAKLKMFGDISDKLLIGDFSAAYKESVTSLINEPDPELVVICSYSNSFRTDEIENNHQLKHLSGKNDCLLDKIINWLTEMLQNGQVSGSNAYNELNKLSLNFSTLSVIDAINFLVNSENSHFEDNLSVRKTLPYRLLSVHPFFVDSFALKTNKKRYLDLIESYYNTTVSFDICSALYHLEKDRLPTSLFAEQYSLISGMMNYKDGNYSKAISDAEKLISSPIKYFSRIGYGLISRALLKNGNYEEACKLIGSCLVSNNDYYPYLPFAELSTVFKPGTQIWRSVNKFIELSIVLDACVKHYNQKLEINRRFAYEDFLLKSGVSKPSELFSKIELFERKKIVYYLRYICIESNMDTSSAFAGGSSEVLEERLKICRFLLELESGVNAIESEVRDLVRRKVITSRRQEVDKSRIYVDLERVKVWAEKELSENFGRYMAYMKSNIEGKVTATDSLKKHEPLAITPTSAIDIPENEVNDLLRYMYEQIRDVYLSYEFGLDRFISTRIRHGELERNMRKPFQKHELITKREYENGPYLRNAYWFQKLNIKDRYFQKEFDKAFSTFSETYDNQISKIASEWLQIKRTDKGSGLFNFMVYDEDVINFSKAINPDSSLKDFIDLVIVSLESTLMINLIVIQEQLNKKAKDETKTIINTLQEKTQSILPNNSSLLQNAINQGRVDFQTQLNKIIDWFVPSASGNSPPFSIQDAMIAAEAIIKEANPAFKVNDVPEDDSIAIHGQLPIFADIFINIFENVVKRSGLDSPEAFVKMKTEIVEEELTVISVTVENELGPNVDIKQVTEELNRKKELLKTGNYAKYVATEKNSGLFKIYRSVLHFSAIGFDLKPTVDFGIIETKFFITMTFPLRTFTLSLTEEKIEE